MDETIYIKNEDHYKSLLSVLRHFAEVGSFTDITLELYNNVDVFSFHYVVFTSYSQYYDNNMVVESFTKFRIELKQDYRLIAAFWCLLYNGTCCVELEKSAEFYDLLCELKVYDCVINENPLMGKTTVYINNHEEKLFYHFWICRENYIQCDLTLISNSMSNIPVQSVILSTQSNYLCQIITNRINKESPSALYLPYSSHVVHKIIDYCFTGSICCRSSAIKEIYSASYFLGIDTLSEHIQKFLMLPDSKSKQRNLGIVKILNPPSEYMSSLTKKLKLNKNDFSYIWISDTCFRVHSIVLMNYSARVRTVFGKHNLMETDYIMIFKFLIENMRMFIRHMYTGQETTLDPRIIHWFCITIRNDKVCALPYKETSNIFEGQTHYEDAELNTTKLRYKCFKCSERFHSEVESLIHLEKHLEEFEDIHSEGKDGNGNSTRAKGSFKCKKCKVRCSTRKQLRKHVAKHLYAKRYICSSCNKEFISRRGYNYHINLHNEKKMIVCQVCGRYIRKEELELHLLRHKNQVACQICHKVFTIYGLHRHMKWVHEKVPNFICDLCHQHFSNKIQLREHLLNVHKYKKGSFVMSQTFSCDTCSRSFFSQKKLDTHRQIHLKLKNQKKTFCSICKRVFTNLDLLLKHQKIHTHIIEKISSENLDSSSITESVNINDKVACTVCKKLLTSKEKIQEHTCDCNSIIELRKEPHQIVIDGQSLFTNNAQPESSTTMNAKCIHCQEDVPLQFILSHQKQCRKEQLAILFSNFNLAALSNFNTN